MDIDGGYLRIVDDGMIQQSTQLLCFIGKKKIMSISLYVFGISDKVVDFLIVMRIEILAPIGLNLRYTKIEVRNQNQ